MTTPRPTRRRLPRVQVPAALAVAYVGFSCLSPNYIAEEGCGDNNPECETRCFPIMYRDASVPDADIRPVTCPKCAYDNGQCPRGCQPSESFG